MSKTEQCEYEVIKAFEMARKKMGIVMKVPRVCWNLRGRAAGRAHLGEDKIEFNPVLMAANFEDFLKQVTYHEVAHFIAFKQDPGDRAHGKTWAHVMWNFGRPAKRCHNYDVGAAKPKTICHEIT